MKKEKAIRKIKNVNKHFTEKEIRKANKHKKILVRFNKNQSEIQILKSHQFVKTEKLVNFSIL